MGATFTVEMELQVYSLEEVLCSVVWLFVAVL